MYQTHLSLRERRRRKRWRDKTIHFSLDGGGGHTKKKQLHPKKKKCISVPFFSVLVIIMKHITAREAWTKTVGQEDSLQEKLWVTVVLNDIFDILCF